MIITYRRMVGIYKCGKAIINESKLKSYHCPTFAQQQKFLLTVITPSREGATQEVERALNSRSSSNGKVNHSKTQPGKADAKSSRKHHSYVRTSTRITLTHLKSLQSRYLEGHTAKSRRRDLKRGGNATI